MLNRRSFLQTTTAAYLAAALPEFATAETSNSNLIRQVDPRIGTGGHGHCFPGATLPFGAVQLSPDTFNDNWDWCSGYHVSDNSIMGFSHTHLSGTGCGDLLDFLIMPGAGEVKLSPGTRENPELGYRSRFDHSDEVCEPGYYSVLLKRSGIRAELTATERTGLSKFTFPKTGDYWLIVDLAHSYLSAGKSTVQSAQLHSPDPSSLSGGHITRSWGHDRHCYLHLQSSQQPTEIVFYSEDQPVNQTTLQGANLKAVLHFHVQAGEAIYIRTGISGVSTQGAARNLVTEQPNWDFNAVRMAAQQKWDGQLSRVQASIPNPEQSRVFYTALYHMLLGPTLFDDVDGQYRGMDAQIHKLPKGQHNYTTFSLWDTFRAAHPAYTLIQGDRIPDFANTLIRMAEQSPRGMPVWPLQGTETGTMTGYHSASVIAEAIHKGFPGIDSAAAYRVMMKRAMQDNYRGLAYYRKLGFIPADKEDESVSKTFEYCYADWAIAHVAASLGKSDDAKMLRDRSRNYAHYFNPANRFMQPKLENGDWAMPFDPKEMGHAKRFHDFTESNSWQTTFGIQHDPAGLIALFGSRETFVAKLDELFNQPSVLPSDAPPDIAGLVGQYAHGNEPSHHIAYLYTYAGVPHKTQERVRSLLDTMYSAKPDGMAGNEDVGQMSAWFILSALGFYPVDPVSGNYILGSPIVDHAKLQLGPNRFLEIQVKRPNASDAYVHSFALNGKSQYRLWFNHKEIAEGGLIQLEMGPKPQVGFGTIPSSLPPSLQL